MVSPVLAAGGVLAPTVAPGGPAFVSPLRLRTVSANVFTDPELATVGVSQNEVDSGKVPARQVMLPLSGNARAKMAGLTDGFVKLFCRPASGQVGAGRLVVDGELGGEPGPGGGLA